MTTAYERRFFATEFETRAAGDTLTIEGYALKFNKPSQNLGGFREDIAPGATTKTIQEADIRGLVNHDPTLVLGRNKSGTMDVSEDGTGVFYRIQADLRQSYTKDLAIAMERGDVTQSSFGFRTIKDDWGIDEDDFPRRTLKEISLLDVSPVTYPAYLDSTSGLGSRALQMLAESRSLTVDLSDVDALRAAIRGDAIPEPDPAAHIAEEQAANTTQVVIPLFDEAFEVGIRARLLNIR